MDLSPPHGPRNLGHHSPSTSSSALRRDPFGLSSFSVHAIILWRRKEKVRKGQGGGRGGGRTLCILVAGPPPPPPPRKDPIHYPNPSKSPKQANILEGNPQNVWEMAKMDEGGEGKE